MSARGINGSSTPSSTRGPRDANSTLSACLGLFSFRLLAIVGVFVSSVAHSQERFDFHSIRRSPRSGATDGRYEGELYFLQHGKARDQGMRHYGPQWSGDSHFLWDGNIGDEARVAIRLPRTSHYRLKFQFTRAPDYGAFHLLLDGKQIGKTVDLFAPSVQLASLVDLGEFKLSEGKHALTFRLVQANPKAVKFEGKTYMLGFDYVQAIDLKPAKPEIPQDEPLNVQPVEAITLSHARQLVSKYCIRCHSGKEPKGELDVKRYLVRQAKLDTDGLANDRNDRDEHIALTEQIGEAIDFATMPPEQEDQPSSTERKQLAQFFNKVVDRHIAQADSLPPVVMRRLTRYEYNNAVRDLLNLRGDIYPLPEKTLRAYSRYFWPATGSTSSNGRWRFPTRTSRLSKNGAPPARQKLRSTSEPHQASMIA